MGYAIGAFRKARGLKPEDPNDFEIYSNAEISAKQVELGGVPTAGLIGFDGRKICHKFVT